jgi:hypothetical protein
MPQHGPHAPIRREHPPPGRSRGLDHQLPAREDPRHDATTRPNAHHHTAEARIGGFRLREFIQRNLHATAEVEDLQAIAEETSGEDLSRFFAAWVTETVVPDLPRTDG